MNIAAFQTYCERLDKWDTPTWWVAMEPPGRGGKIVTKYRTGKDACSLLDTLNSDLGFDIYSPVNRFTEDGRTRAHIDRLVALYADFDGPFEPGAIGVPPSMTVESSAGRTHMYWILKGVHTATDVLPYVAMQKALVTVVGADKAAVDIARLLRVPGFLNNKRGVQCTIKEQGDYVSFSVMKKWLEPYISAPKHTIESDPLGSQGLVGESTRSYLFQRKLGLLGTWPESGKGQRNAWIYRLVAMGVHDYALQPADVAYLVHLRSVQHWHDEKYSLERITDIARNATRFGQHRPAKAVHKLSVNWGT